MKLVQSQAADGDKISDAKKTRSPLNDRYLILFSGKSSSDEFTDCEAVGFPVKCPFIKVCPATLKLLFNVKIILCPLFFYTWNIRYLRSLLFLLAGFIVVTPLAWRRQLSHMC